MGFGCLILHNSAAVQSGINGRCLSVMGLISVPLWGDFAQSRSTEKPLNGVLTVGLRKIAAVFSFDFKAAADLADDGAGGVTPAQDAL